MTQPRIVGIAGSVRRPSKTRSLIEALGAKAAQARAADFVAYDLADIGSGLGSSLSRAQLTSDVKRVLSDIETADALIVGTPVYKGSYAGLFKHLFDFVEPDALRNVPVVLTATGGGQRHALVVEQHLRPLFGFFKALTIPTAVYASEADFSGGQLADAAVIERIAAAAAQLSALLSRRSVHAFNSAPLRLSLAR
jgi:FMN reductase